MTIVVVDPEFPVLALPHTNFSVVGLGFGFIVDGGLAGVVVCTFHVML